MPTTTQLHPSDAAAYLVRSVDNRYSGFSRLTDDYLNTTAAGILSKGPKCEGNSVWADEGSVWMLCSQYALAIELSGARLLSSTHGVCPACRSLTGWHANPAILVRSNTPTISARKSWTMLGNPMNKSFSYDSQPTYVLPLDLPQGRLRLYMGDRWNEGSESAPGSVGGASYVWLPLLRNASAPTGWSMPLLAGKWNATGQWKVADYLQKSY